MTISTRDLIISAMRKIRVLGLDQTAPDSTELAMALSEFNEIFGQRNTRSRNSKFIRSQSWAFTTAKASYTIGAAADAPDFAVTAGGPPTEIESAKIINPTGSSDLEMPCDVWTKAEYDAQVNMPQLASSFPTGIYYQPSFPLAVIFPWPAYPAFTNYKLQLAWPDQLVEVALADIGTAIRLAPGLQRDLTLQLAVALCLPYGLTPSAELLKQAHEAATDYASLNRRPPTIATDGGMNRGGGGWNWLTHRPG